MRSRCGGCGGTGPARRDRSGGRGGGRRLRRVGATQVYQKATMPIAVETASHRFKIASSSSMTKRPGMPQASRGSPFSSIRIRPSNGSSIGKVPKLQNGAANRPSGFHRAFRNFYRRSALLLGIGSPILVPRREETPRARLAGAAIGGALGSYAALGMRRHARQRAGRSRRPRRRPATYRSPSRVTTIGTSGCVSPAIARKPASMPKARTYRLEEAGRDDGQRVYRDDDNEVRLTMGDGQANLQPFRRGRLPRLRGGRERRRSSDPTCFAPSASADRHSRRPHVASRGRRQGRSPPSNGQWSA